MSSSQVFDRYILHRNMIFMLGDRFCFFQRHKNSHGNKHTHTNVRVVRIDAYIENEGNYPSPTIIFNLVYESNKDFFSPPAAQQVKLSGEIIETQFTHRSYISHMYS